MRLKNLNIRGPEISPAPKIQAIWLGVTLAIIICWVATRLMLSGYGDGAELDSTYYDLLRLNRITAVVGPIGLGVSLFWLIRNRIRIAGQPEDPTML